MIKDILTADEIEVLTDAIAIIENMRVKHATIDPQTFALLAELDRALGQFDL